jgi:hypothetical protein
MNAILAERRNSFGSQEIYKHFFGFVFCEHFCWQYVSRWEVSLGDVSDSRILLYVENTHM